MHRSDLSKEKLTACIFTAVLLLSFIALYPAYRSNRNAMQEEHPYTETTIDWEALYPFAKEPSTPQTGAVSDTEPAGVSLWQKLDAIGTGWAEKVQSIEQRFTTLSEEGMPFRYRLSELFCRYENILGIQRVDSSDGPVLIKDDGWMAYQYAYANDENNEVIVQKLKGFQDQLSEKDIDYLYVLAPSKSADEDEDGMSYGYEDHTITNIWQLSYLLNTYGVNNLNLQEYFQDQDFSYDENFFKTDHHWTPEAALKGAERTAEMLNESYGFDIDLSLYDREKYISTVYPSFFLGSQGKKTTLGYGAPEDFELLIPSFDTRFHVSIANLVMDQTGPFDTALIDQSQLKALSYPWCYYQGNAYAAYGYSDRPEICIHNENVKDGKKILILKDSFGDAMVPYLSSGVSDIHELDLRLFTGSVQAYIDEYQPDLVMHVICGGSQNPYSSYEEHKNLMDVR